MSHSSTRFIIILDSFPAPDILNFLGQYFMLNGTDYAQQTRAINAIDDETIRENDFNEIRRIMYDQAAIMIQDNERRNTMLITCMIRLQS